MNIEKLARKAGLLPTDIGPVVETRYARAKAEKIKRFAALVLEEAAKVADSQIERWVDDRARYCASECAASIRAFKDKT